MKYHTRTPVATIRSWAPAIQIGHIASEISRADGWLGRGAMAEAVMSLRRARELFAVLETAATVPVEWHAALIDTMKLLDVTRIEHPDAVEVRITRDELSEIVRRNLG